MHLSTAIEFLEEKIKNPHLGLSEEVFLLVSRLTPLVNVDLLIQDEKGRTLLAWRNDRYTGKGWHVPGGILRFKETLQARLQKVIETEIGTEVKIEPRPLAVNQLIFKKKTRGHFISFLYKCFLPSSFSPLNKGRKENEAGYLKWFNNSPENLIDAQIIYKKYLDNDKK